MTACHRLAVTSLWTGSLRTLLAAGLKMSEVHQTAKLTFLLGCDGAILGVCRLAQCNYSHFNCKLGLSRPLFNVHVLDSSCDHIIATTTIITRYIFVH